MSREQDLAVKMVEVLGKRRQTEEEKKLLALIKEALYADDLMAFLGEVHSAFNGCGKVSSETVKRAIEFAKAHNEVQIRKTEELEDNKDKLVEQEIDRLKRVEVWILGSLAYWGLLK